MPRLQTLVLKYTANDVVDLARLENIRDVSFWNPSAAGTSKTVNITINGILIPIAEGDPMLSFGGYDNIFRNDNISISFITAAGKTVSNFFVFANKVLPD